MLKLMFWVCNVNTVLISVNSLAKGGLTTLFTPTEAWIFKDDTSVKLTKQGPLWYLPVYGRITDNMKQADEKHELYDYPIMPVGLPPPHPHNNWADYWVINHTLQRGFTNEQGENCTSHVTVQSH